MAIGRTGISRCTRSNASSRSTTRSWIPPRAARESAVLRSNRTRIPHGGRYFIIEVNGRPIFAKGGNWVPPDIIYSRIDAERYRKLVELAVEANFNCLRIWGGGLYADHALLEACDEMGVMVWHDFIFACSKYPSDDPEFLANVREEITHQVRDLSPHPSLIVWCGNNELEWGAWGWGYDKDKAWPDYALYHLEMPRILAEEDPSRPYWPSSPYSLDMTIPERSDDRRSAPLAGIAGRGRGELLVVSDGFQPVPERGRRARRDRPGDSAAVPAGGPAAGVLARRGSSTTTPATTGRARACATRRWRTGSG